MTKMTKLTKLNKLVIKKIYKKLIRVLVKILVKENEPNQLISMLFTVRAQKMFCNSANNSFFTTETDIIQAECAL